MRIRYTTRLRAFELLVAGIALCLLTSPAAGALGAPPQASPDHFLLVLDCNPAPDEVQIQCAQGAVTAVPISRDLSRLTAELPRAAMERDGSITLQLATDQREMSDWAIYVLPGWSAGVVRNRTVAWMREQSLCFEQGHESLPQRVTIDRYPPVTVEFDESSVSSILLNDEELLGPTGSGFCIGDAFEPLEGSRSGDTGTVRLTYQDPEAPRNILEVVATRSGPDRIRFDCTYTVTQPRDEDVPVHLVLRPGSRLLGMRTYTWRHGGSSGEMYRPVPEAGEVGEEYAVLAQTPFVRLDLDSGPWLGVLDHDQSNIILGAGRDENNQQYVRVSTYLWPREPRRKYTWSFELIGGWNGDYNALLQALAPHTRDFEEHYDGAMVDQDRARDAQAAYAQGARVLWHHGWFHRNGQYFDPTRPFDEVYQTVWGTWYSYEQLQSNIEACHEAGLSCNVYMQFAGVSEDVADAFTDAIVRDRTGEMIVAGRDGNYENIWVNPDPRGAWGASVLRQIDALLEATDADGIALDRTDRLDFTYEPDVYDYSSFNGYSSVFPHETGRQPVSSITVAGREWFTELRALLDRHEAGLISSVPLSPRVVRLSDGVLIDQPLTPNSLFFMKALANGKSLYLLDIEREMESASDEPLQARLAQARPYLEEGANWTEPDRLGRLLYAISEGADYPTLWYFDNGYTRMKYDPAARSVPAMYAGSRFVSLGEQEQGVTLARGGAASPQFEAPRGTPAEQLAELPRFGMQVFGAREETEEESAEQQRPEAVRPRRQVEAGEEPAQQVAGEAVPPSYVVGPGDELAVRVWTDTIEHIAATPMVDVDGHIYLDLLGAVTVGGQTISEVRTDLRRRFAAFFNRAEVSVGLSRTRVIEVRVTGDVTRPGKYRLSGAATVFSALYAAGGPSEIGSLRRIRLIRGDGPVAEIDLYDYLLQGDPRGDLPLSPEDTVFVAPSGPTVGITGQILRPARYELVGRTTLADLIQMAGGLAASAYTRGVQIWRVGPTGERELLNVNLAEGADGFEVQGGDLVVIPSVLEEPRNVVEIEGPVRRPGSYQYRPGMTISDLIDDAQGLTTEAHAEEAYLWRLNEDLDYEMTSFDLRAALRNGGSDDRALEPGDRIVVLSEREVEAPMLVSVEGAVRDPREMVWKQGMRVADVIKLAGGLAEGAFTERANVMRIGDDARRYIVPVNIGAAIAGDAEENIVVERGDVVQVLLRSEVTEPSEVQVEGLVNEPGTYERFGGMRVSDAIVAAGGLKRSAGEQVEYTPGGVFERVEPVYLSLQRDGDSFRVEPDPILNDNDLVAVLGAGDYIVQPSSVTIRGRVKRPGAYALRTTAEDRDTVYDLIQRAGGLLPDANPNGIVLYRLREEIIREEQEEDLQHMIAHFNRELSAATLEGEQQRVAGTAAQVSQGLQAALFEGADTVVIPPRQLSSTEWARAVPIDGQRLIEEQGGEEDFPLAPGDVILVPEVPTTVTVMGAVVRSGAIPYEEGMTARQAIDRAGKATPDARLGRMVVIRANGRVVADAGNVELYPGDIVLVPSDYLFREVNEPGTLERVLSTISGIVTGYLIFN